ncbi:hypothetical protein SAMN05216251_11048 [Actinacidiphila alni]|uniref:Uncharacterized protein n=1 Tax=Actinacidiphila alni TaxID=380248 RepID=A0A1I2H1B0_9ACTN|nr:hypothetical protein SAMN05216251_11048 [Actinacidiphila alni]
MGRRDPTATPAKLPGMRRRDTVRAGAHPTAADATLRRYIEACSAGVDAPITRPRPEPPGTRRRDTLRPEAHPTAADATLCRCLKARFAGGRRDPTDTRNRQTRDAIRPASAPNRRRCHPPPMPRRPFRGWTPIPRTYPEPPGTRRGDTVRPGSAPGPRRCHALPVAVARARARHPRREHRHGDRPGCRPRRGHIDAAPRLRVQRPGPVVRHHPRAGRTIRRHEEARCPCAPRAPNVPRGGKRKPGGPRDSATTRRALLTSSWRIATFTERDPRRPGDAAGAARRRAQPHPARARRAPPAEQAALTTLPARHAPTTLPSPDRD